LSDNRCRVFVHHKGTSKWKCHFNIFHRCWGADPLSACSECLGLRLETCKATEKSHVGTLIAATKSMESAYRSRYGNSSTASETAMLTATYVYVNRHICYTLILRVQIYINACK
jgi:hypothetical protein